ncbi:hypothetical protein [Dyadobacter sp. OTU695]|uniref:hypothetical protein n=1 Tax=Dyadobacter sp. OTU695 TaxID=3043860 RepID=UPI00313D8417
MRALNEKEIRICEQLRESEEPLNFIFDFLEWNLGDFVMRIEYADTLKEGKVKVFYEGSLQQYGTVSSKMDAYYNEIREIITIIQLIRLLENEGLVTIYTSVKLRGFTNIGSREINDDSKYFEFPDPEISALILRYATKQVLLTAEFNAFVANGYITQEEFRARRSEKISRNALWVGIIALIISFLALANDLGYLPKKSDSMTNQAQTQGVKVRITGTDTIVFPPAPSLRPTYKPIAK